MIEARNLVKSFEQTRALDGLTLMVLDGAVYGLVGPNGAGKSTLIRSLVGVLPGEGYAALAGIPVENVHLLDSLMKLTYNLEETKGEDHV